MGPVMNLLLAVVVTGGRAVSGRRGAGVRGSAAGRRRGHRRTRRPRRPDIQPGDRIVSVAGRDVDTWEQFFIAVGTRPNREVSIVLHARRPRDRRARSRRSCRPARAGSRSATSACCRTCIRTSRRSTRASRPSARASRPATSSSPSTASRSRSRTSSARRSPSIPSSR